MADGCSKDEKQGLSSRLGAEALRQIYRLCFGGQVLSADGTKPTG